MGVKIKETPQTPQPESKPASPATDGRVLLELSLYTNYTKGGEAYKKGIAYAFSQEQAMLLLAETDTGRPVWKLHRKQEEVQVIRKETPVVDASKNKVEPTPEPPPGSPEPPKAINIGDESELAELGLDGPDGEDVAV